MPVGPPPVRVCRTSAELLRRRLFQGGRRRPNSGAWSPVIRKHDTTADRFPNRPPSLRKTARASGYARAICTPDPRSPAAITSHSDMHGSAIPDMRTDPERNCPFPIRCSIPELESPSLMNHAFSLPMVVQERTRSGIDGRARAHTCARRACSTSLPGVVEGGAATRCLSHIGEYATVGSPAIR